MTSDPRPAPAWLGDVGLGVRAWAGEDRSEPTRGATKPAGRRSRSGRSGESRQGGTPGTRRRRTGADAPPPEDTAAKGPPADPESVARKILLDALTGRACTRKELADKLAKKEVPAELAERLLDRFTEVGLIDDAAFAQQWISSRQPGKGLARRALAQELRRKGVDDETAREALDEIDPADEEEAARRLVRRKLRSVRGLDRRVATRRLVGMLARKGYGGAVAFSVVRSELDADGFGSQGDDLGDATHDLD